MPNSSLAPGWYSAEIYPAENAYLPYEVTADGRVFEGGEISGDQEWEGKDIEYLGKMTRLRSLKDHVAEILAVIHDEQKGLAFDSDHDRAIVATWLEEFAEENS